MRAPPASRLHRGVAALLGSLLVGMAALIVVWSNGGIGPLIATLVLFALGVDAVLSALRKRISLLERIGPLP
jgi:hypothetical protein